MISNNLVFDSVDSDEPVQLRLLSLETSNDIQSVAEHP